MTALIVPRTCTEIRNAKDRGESREPVPRPLEDFRNEPAYVLLGDPGAGKSTLFDRECAALGDEAVSVPPRDLIHFEVPDHPEWVGKTLFIDGLDEVRAGAADARTPFDRIRQKLDALGKPRFRLSCRQADWLGTNDLQNLETVAPGGKVTLLQLDTLTRADVRTILKSDPLIEDSDSFVQQAEHRNIGGMLFNPQSLKLLVAAVGEEDWPESRLQTFEWACRNLAAEQNLKHARVVPMLPSEQLLTATGRLCAVSLLTGIAGFALNSKLANADYPDLSHCMPGDREAGRQAVVTMLFTADGDGRFAVVHRHIAEFLGARYLAGIVEAGLPLGRVLALLTGADGGVVTPLRGLSAWLAAYCPRSRGELIERDPVGVGLYGDLVSFGHEEKLALLQSLSTVAPEQLAAHQAAAFAPLADPQLESTFREILTRVDPGECHQQLLYFLLQILKEGVRLSALAPIFLEIVSDEMRPPDVNAAALDAFLHCHDGADKAKILRGLLLDSSAGRMSDPYREILGTTLALLYPRDLPPTEIWDYLYERHARDSLYLGSYQAFWEFDLLRQSSDQQVCELLDECRGRIAQVRAALTSQSTETLLPGLVARALNFCGDGLSAARLYDWLGIGLPEEGLACNNDETENIRSWLGQRPEIQKAVLLEGVMRCTDTEEFLVYTDRVVERLYGARLPEDFGPWCLDKALALTDVRPSAAEFLLLHAVTTGGLEAALVQQRLVGKPQLTEFLGRVSGIQPHSSAVMQPPPPYEDRAIEQQRRAEEWQHAIRAQRSMLLENRAAPRLLHQLASKYFGSFVGFQHVKGRKRIAELVGSDCELLHAVLSALQDVILREDVPDFENGCRIYGQGQIHYLGLPYLAGLAMSESAAPLEVSEWTPEERRKSAALYLTVAHADYEPAWYRRLVKQHPDAVADAQIRLAAIALRDGRNADYNLFRFAHDQSHAEVAQRACLPLLQAFPTRCRAAQFATLDQLLRAALLHADRTALEATIARKLSRKSMNPLQRAHWFAAGCLVASKTYLKSMADFAKAGRDEERVRHILALFCADGSLAPSLGDLDIPTTKLLVRLGGESVGPEAGLQSGSAIVRVTLRASALVSKLIQRLAQDPSPDAGNALQALAADENLSRWHPAIDAAINEQRVVWRDHSYRVPSLDQVLETLSGRNPSGPADLAALATELLRVIGRRIRTSNTDDWRQYWNDGNDHLPDRPKHENLCRDALLSDLRKELPQAVDAQPEGEYAGDRRADIRIACDDFQVPVEVKKNTHRDLWSAMRNQLIEHYTAEPATAGYGLYVAFWFGANLTQLPPSGRRPANPEDLEKRLLEALSAEERRRVSVCVIDVSRP